MSRKKQPRLVLTERGEWVMEGLGAVAALVAIPGCFWVLAKLVGL